MRTSHALLAGLLLVAIALGLWPPRARAEQGNVRAASRHSIAAAASTNLLTAALSPPAADDVVHYVATIGLVTTGSVVYYSVSDGTTVTQYALNKGTALTAGVSYVLNWSAAYGLTYQLQVATATTADILIEESRGPITAQGF